MSGSIFIGGVQASWQCLQRLCEEGQVPRLVFGYDESLAKRSGYKDFGDLQKRFGFALVRTHDINDSRHIAQMREIQPDVIWVIGWSQLVKPPILQLPSLGCVGIHPTALPLGRGRAPIPWTLIHDLKKSAVTLLYLVEKADAGDVIAQKEFTVEDNDDAKSVYQKMEELHEALVKENMVAILEGRAPRKKQDESKATYWTQRKPEDGLIRWAQNPKDLYNWVRALTHPYPGAFTFYNKRKLFVWSAEWVRQKMEVSGKPGTLFAEVLGTGEKGGGILVQTNNEPLLLRSLQWEDGPEVSARELLADQSLKLGGSFET